MTETPLFDRYATPSFGGESFDPELDGDRLGRLLDRVQRLMLDGRWRSIPEIQRVTGGSESSVSARLRDLRKKQYGGWTVERRRRGNPKDGIFEYQVRVREGNDE